MKNGFVGEDESFEMIRRNKFAAESRDSAQKPFAEKSSSSTGCQPPSIDAAGDSGRYCGLRFRMNGPVILTVRLREYVC